MIFEIDRTPTKHLDAAKAVLQHGNNIAQSLVELFLSAKQSVFGPANGNIQELQALFDAMEVLSPGSGVKSFQLHAAMGEFIAATNPGALTEDDLKAPVAYTIEVLESGPRLKFLEE